MKLRNRQSPRLQGYNYSQDGYYFITVVTKNRNPCLGKFIEREVVLSEAGKLVEQEYYRCFEFKGRFSHEELCIMPDHVHFLIKLGDPKLPRWVMPDQSDFLKQRFGGKVHALGSFMRDFKRVSTIRIRNAGTPEFGWHSRYHDHIVRDHGALERIKLYIRNNPVVEWERQKLKL